ncbi:erg26, C-3 sterol dehydrogenase [Thelotrema lepadinum]|nr:erg26, C-3 sterol dehydrogenase [Thelotrema lepadinum]
MASPQISYLIIGGCGFLGHHIVSQLLDTHTAQVSVLDLRTDRNRFPGVQYYNADLTSRKEVTDVLEKAKPTVLIHTASPLAIGDNRPLFDKVNVTGTENLLACAAQSGTVKAFVFTSSSSIIHDGVSDIIYADESYPILNYPEQHSYYSHTKGVAEKLVLAANRKSSNMLTVAIRPAGIFGEGDAQLMPGLLEAYYTGKTNIQLGKNQNQWDATYVGNVAHAHLLAARALLQTQTIVVQPLDHEKIDGEAFIVTNDEPMPFWTFARTIWKAAGWKGSASDAWVMPTTLALIIATMLEWIYWVVFFGKRQSLFRTLTVRQSTITRTFNISKAKRRLGYMPLLSVHEGVKRGVKWFEVQERGRAKLEEKKKTK